VKAGLMERERSAGTPGPPPIPRLPVFGWQALRGAREAATPCMLELPGLHYTTSGRAAILLALQTLGLGPRDAVLLPSYHCPTMVAPARHLGAQVRFYPIDAQGTPRLDWLAQQDLQGVRVLLAAHFFGLPQPMAPVRAWCSQRGIALIEDCAHALFGRSGGQAIGSWGDVAIASLTKFLPVPEGGCLVVNPGASQAAGKAPPPLNACGLGSQLRAATDILELGAAHRRLGGLNGLVRGALAAMRSLRARTTPDDVTGQPDGGNPNALPPGGTLSAAEQQIDSTLAHRRLSVASRWLGNAVPRARIVERRRAHYAWLAQRLAGHQGLRPLLPDLPPDCAPYVFPLWVDTPDPGYAELRQLRMPVFRWDRLWPGVPALPGDHGPRWSHHVLQLACHQDLQADDMERFARALLRLYAP
jgi:perosamine synthetase